MAKQGQHSFVQIFVGISISLLTALLLYRLGFEKAPAPPTASTTGRSAPDRSEPPAHPEPPPPQKPRFITATVTKSLTIDPRGFGQIAENLAITINGSTHQLSLSVAGGKSMSSVRFKLPRPGFFDFEIAGSTIFNNHHAPGQQCTHYGRGRGQIYIDEGKTFVIMGEGFNLPTYRIFLQDF